LIHDTHAGKSKPSWRTQLRSLYRSSVVTRKRLVVYNPFQQKYLMSSIIEISKKNFDIWTHDIQCAQVFSDEEEAKNAAAILSRMVGFNVHLKHID